MCNALNQIKLDYRKNRELLVSIEAQWCNRRKSGGFWKWKKKTAKGGETLNVAFENWKAAMVYVHNVVVWFGLAVSTGRVIKKLFEPITSLILLQIIDLLVCLFFSIQKSRRLAL